MATQTSAPNDAAVDETDGTPGSETTPLISPYDASITVTELLGGPLTTAARLPTSATSAGVPPTRITFAVALRGSISETVPPTCVTQTKPAQVMTAVARRPASAEAPATSPLTGSMRTRESARATVVPLPPSRKAATAAAAVTAAIAAPAADRRGCARRVRTPAVFPGTRAARAASTSALPDSQRVSGAFAIPCSSTASSSRGSSGRSSLAFGGAS